MTLRKCVYQLCKILHVNENNSELLQIYESINYRKDGIGDRSSFGYLARQIGYQFMGYLLAHRDKEELTKKFPPLRWNSTLSQHEVELLEDYSGQIIKINRLCIEPVISKAPEIEKALIPYLSLDYPSISERKVSLIQDDGQKELSDEYSKHYAVNVIQNVIDEVIKTTPIEEIIKASFGLEKMLLSHGPLSGPQELMMIILQDENTIEKKKFRLYSAMMCLRASINIMNELFYKSIYSAKLPVINQSNTIQYNSIINSIGGLGLEVLCQPDKNLDLHDLGLILIKDESLSIPVDLCKIEGLEVSESEEAGVTARLLLRAINEELNPYEEIIRKRD